MIIEASSAWLKNPEKIICIVGPYYHVNKKVRDLNIAQAERAELALVRKGWGVFCPHKNTARFDDLIKMPESFYQKFDLLMMKRCGDAIFKLLDSGTSKGTQGELQYNNDVLHYPVFSRISDVPLAEEFENWLRFSKDKIKYK